MVNMRINYEAYKLIFYSVLFTRHTHTHTKSADFACKSMTSVDFGQNVGFAPRQHEVKWNIQRIYSMIISDWRRCQWEILKIHRRLCNDRMFSKTEFDKSSKMAFKVENSVSTSFKNAFYIRIAPPFCVEFIFYELFFIPIVDTTGFLLENDNFAHFKSYRTYLTQHRGGTRIIFY